MPADGGTDGQRWFPRRGGGSPSLERSVPRSYPDYPKAALRWSLRVPDPWGGRRRQPRLSLTFLLCSKESPEEPLAGLSEEGEEVVTSGVIVGTP